MSIKTIIIGLVVLAAAGGGVFVTMNGKDKDASTTESNSQSSATQASINGLLAQNKNLRCTFNTADETGNRSSGTAYISGERMRGDFTLQVAGQAEQKSNVLRDDSFQYVWSEGATTGFKTSISAVDSADSQDKQGQKLDQDKEYDFDCANWSVDESMFRAPGNVEFTDYSAQVQQSQEIQQSISNVCAQIADTTARTACEQAL